MQALNEEMVFLLGKINTLHSVIQLFLLFNIYFVLGRMGNNKEALHLIIEKEANVKKVFLILDADLSF